MTPVLWLDPVAAAAIAAGLTPAVGLGQLVCANDCTRFGGQVPGHTRGSNWDWVPCGDCNGTGLVQPSGPQTMLIGATADMSDDLVYDYQDHLAAVDGPADVVWTSIGPHWGWHLAIRPAGEEWTSSNTTYRPIHPASILGTATVAYEINEALPFGPWTPGGPAAIVTDYRDTIDCDGETLSGPLSWSDAPTSPCITTIDLKENAA